MSAAAWQHDAEARDLSRKLSVASLRARECALDIVTHGGERDAANALRALAAAASAVAGYTGAIVHARDGIGDLHALAATLNDLISNTAGHYRPAALSPVDLRNIRLDERSKAQREDAA